MKESSYDLKNHLNKLFQEMMEKNPLSGKTFT